METEPGPRDRHEPGDGGKAPLRRRRVLLAVMALFAVVAVHAGSYVGLRRSGRIVYRQVGPGERFWDRGREGLPRSVFALYRPLMALEKLMGEAGLISGPKTVETP